MKILLTGTKYIIFTTITVFIIFQMHNFLCPINLKHNIAMLFSETPQPIYCTKFPKIVHLMYVPWNHKTGILKSNENDFDHSFYEEIKLINIHYKINLWTLPKIKQFTNKFYPKYNEIWNKIKHPVQAIDFFRLLVVYHYGGVYWQYGSRQLAAMECFTPPKNKTIRLFVECMLNQRFSESKKTERIRDGKPEEIVRVVTGCFAAYPKNTFLNSSIEKSWNNINTFEIKNQYDILYVGGNAMFSESYDQYVNKKSITLTYNTNKYISFYSQGSWRLSSY
jgi:hypothetical protein